MSGAEQSTQRLFRLLGTSDRLQRLVDPLGQSRLLSAYVGNTPGVMSTLQEQLAQIDSTRRLLEGTTSSLAQFFEDSERLRLPQLLPPLQIPTVSAELARSIAPHQASFSTLTSWELSLGTRLKALKTPWVLPDHPMSSLVGFAILSRLSDATHSDDPYSQPVSDLLEEELHETIDLEPTASRAERDDAAVDSGLNPELIAFPTDAYGHVCIAAGFRFDLGPVTAPKPPGSNEANGSFDAIHYEVMMRVEQNLRGLIETVLLTEAGPKWPKQRVPEAVRARWKERQAEDRNAGRPVYALIQYADFMDLPHVVGRQDNWPLFAPYFRSLDDFSVSMQRLHPVRKAIAHSRPLARSDVLTLLSEATRIFTALGIPFLKSTPPSQN